MNRFVETMVNSTKYRGCVQSLHFSNFLLEGDPVPFMSNYRRCHISHNPMRFRLSSSLKDKKKTEFNQLVLT